MGFRKHTKSRKITVDTIPTTMEEAMQVLDMYLSEKDKIWLATEENSAIKVHHTLGRWMRNNWGLWREKPNEIKCLFFEQGITHPDDISYAITKEYIKYLKKLGYTNKKPDR